MSVVGIKSDCLVNRSMTTNIAVKPEEGGKCSMKIHRNRIPGLLRNWQLLEQAIGFMSLGLVAHAHGAGFAVVFDKTLDARPSEISLNHFKGFVHTKVSRQDVIVLVLKDTKS